MISHVFFIFPAQFHPFTVELSFDTEVGKLGFGDDVKEVTYIVAGETSESIDITTVTKNFQDSIRNSSLPTMVISEDRKNDTLNGKYYL